MKEKKNLFKKEEEILQLAKAISINEKYKNNPLLEDFNQLLNDYKKIYKQTKKLVKISDHTQKNLNIANKKLKDTFEEIEKLYKELQEKDDIISKDLMMAKKIQTEILSKAYKEINNLDIKIIFQPMIEVGGDIYDIFKIKDQYYRFFIADATGHGIQAALTTMIIKTEYEKLKGLDILPHSILKLFNNQFIKDYYQLNVFFTCLIADFDLKQNKIYYASAGSPDQYIIKDNDVQRMRAGGKMIGIFENVEFELYKFDYCKGDKIVLFTDGAFEEFSEDGVELGENGLENIIEKNKDQSINIFIDKIIQEIDFFRGHAPLNDDITIIGTEYL